MRIVIIVAILAIITVGAAGYFLYAQDDTQQVNEEVAVDCSAADKGSFISRFNELNIDTEDYHDKFSDLAEEIKLNADYKQDINCLYITTDYYVESFMFEEANEDLSLIKTLQDSGQQLSESFEVASVDSLERRIAERRQVQDEVFQNSFVVPAEDENEE